MLFDCLSPHHFSLYLSISLVVTFPFICLFLLSSLFPLFDRLSHHHFVLYLTVSLVVTFSLSFTVSLVVTFPCICLSLSSSLFPLFDCLSHRHFSLYLSVSIVVTFPFILLSLSFSLSLFLSSFPSFSLPTPRTNVLLASHFLRRRRN